MVYQDLYCHVHVGKDPFYYGSYKSLFDHVDNNYPFYHGGLQYHDRLIHQGPFVFLVNKGYYNLFHKNFVTHLVF